MAPSENPTSSIERCRTSTDADSARPSASAVTRDLIEQFRPAVQKLLFCGDPESKSSFAPIERQGVVHRLRPPVKAHGGKYYLARRIVPILLGVRERISEYLELCAFGASVFLAMPRMEREILGDTNPEVCALWTVLGNERLAAALADFFIRHGKGRRVPQNWCAVKFQEFVGIHKRTATMDRA